MDKNLPKRKPNRLRDFDYSSCGAYFITICTKERRNYFWNTVGATIGRPQDVPLTSYGKIVNDAINNIPKSYPQISVDYYAIMPNHIHLILQIYSEDKNGRPMVAPTISRVVGQLKGYVTKQIKEAVWQKSFHDHIIRNRDDYQEISRYIYENPSNWETDELNK